MTGEEWIKVKRVSDGLELMIQKSVYDKKYFTLDSAPKDYVDPIEKARKEAEQAMAAIDRKPVEQVEDNDDELSKGDTEVTQGTKWNEKLLDALSYKDLKAEARKVNPDLKGNASREVCVETILNA